MLGFPTSAPVIFSADGDDDGNFLVGDIQALLQTQPTWPLNTMSGSGTSGELHGGEATNRATAGGVSTVVDLTVSDSETSDNDDKGGINSFPVTVVAPATSESRQSQKTTDQDIIEID